MNCLYIISSKNKAVSSFRPTGDKALRHVLQLHADLKIIFNMNIQERGDNKKW